MTDESNGVAVRSTRQRAAIAAALEETEAFTTAQTLHELLRQRGERVGLATVYRCLQTLVDAGQVDVLRIVGGENAYRRCSQGHHHHLVCRSCGRAIEVDGPGVERWADKIAATHGFSDVSHTLEIFGTCSTCTTSRATVKDPDGVATERRGAEPDGQLNAEEVHDELPTQAWDIAPRLR